MNRLKKIMRQKGIIYETADGDQYEQSSRIVEIRSNCIVVENTCCVINPVYEFYDRHLQLMHRTMVDEFVTLEYTETGIKVSCEGVFWEGEFNYTVDFSNGCAINMADVVTVYYTKDKNNDSCWYVLTNTDMWAVTPSDCQKVCGDVCLKGCKQLESIPANVIDIMNQTLMMEIM